MTPGDRSTRSPRQLLAVGIAGLLVGLVAPAVHALFVNSQRASGELAGPEVSVDRDGDAVADASDVCDTTGAGEPVDDDGCSRGDLEAALAGFAGTLTSRVDVATRSIAETYVLTAQVESDCTRTSCEALHVFFKAWRRLASIADAVLGENTGAEFFTVEGSARVVADADLLATFAQTVAAADDLLTDLGAVSGLLGLWQDISSAQLLPKALDDLGTGTLSTYEDQGNAAAFDFARQALELASPMPMRHASGPVAPGNLRPATCLGSDGTPEWVSGTLLVRRALTERYAALRRQIRAGAGALEGAGDAVTQLRAVRQRMTDGMQAEVDFPIRPIVGGETERRRASVGNAWQLWTLASALHGAWDDHLGALQVEVVTDATDLGVSAVFLYVRGIASSPEARLGFRFADLTRSAATLGEDVVLLARDDANPADVLRKLTQLGPSVLAQEARNIWAIGDGVASEVATLIGYPQAGCP